MIKTSIIYNHRGRFGKDGTAPVEIRVTIDRKPYYINTGVRVRPKNFKFGRVVNCVGESDMNEKLEVMLGRVDAIVTEFLRKGKGTIDVAEVRRRVWSPDKRKKNSDAEDMLAWMDAETEKLNVAIGTLRHYRVSVAALKESGVMKRWSDLTIENIHRFDAFVHSIKKHRTDAEIKMGKPVEYISQATVRNYHKDIRSLLSRALKFGLITSNPYDRMRGEIKRGDKESVEYLSDDERKAIESMNYADGTMICAARDMFIFQMYTGMAYSDMQAFSLDACRRDGDNYIIAGYRVKTGIPYYVQLRQQTLSVVQKYGGSLPQVTVQVYNRNLKKIAKDVGIKKRMTSHVARHTFATWALHNGVPIEIVSKMLGHSDIKMTQRYAKVLAKDVYQQFTKLSSL